MNLRFDILYFLSILCAFLALSCNAYARDYPSEHQKRIRALSAGQAAVEATTDENGITHWRSTVDSGCSYSDHDYTLDIDADPERMSEITYKMSNYDVDYNNSEGCEGGAEVDRMSFNGSELGTLTGANDAWSVNAFPLDKSQLFKGANKIYIDTDATGTGCWCVGVGYIEVSARVGFQVLDHTPTSGEKNRDFHVLDTNLTASFSDDYDPATLTDSTFVLEYPDNTGTWQPVSGLFSQIDSKSFKFIPDFDLKDGVQYRATVKSGDDGVKSLAGDKLEQDTQWTFWTVPDLDIADDFGGGVCAPSAEPCPGLEMAVFQVSRNAPIVAGKDAVARVFSRWKKHEDVDAASQTEEFFADIKFSGGGSGGEWRARLKRPDLYTEEEKKRGADSFNFYHKPTSNAEYTAQVTPTPQSNAAPVVYKSAPLKLGKTQTAPSFVLNYYFLKEGDWAAGATAASKTAGRDMMTKGAEFIGDTFPLIKSEASDQGDLTVGYTKTGNKIDDGICKSIDEVNCPSPPGAPVQMSERRCVLQQLNRIRGANPFVVGIVPSSLCPASNGTTIEKAFIFYSGGGGSYGTVAHELGHIYTLGHTDTNDGIEGFQVRRARNRSATADPTIEPLMHTIGQPAELRWIHNADYAVLQTKVAGGTVAPSLKAVSNAATAGYLIVSGAVDAQAGTGTLGSAYLQDQAQSRAEANGTCGVDLLDAAGKALSGFKFNLPESIDEYASPPTEPVPPATGPIPFTASVPWNDAAVAMRLSCKGVQLAARNRSVVAPKAEFLGLNSGSVLTGVVPLQWQGSDGDSPELGYQVQYSDDQGNLWKNLTPIVAARQFEFDTRLQASNANALLRILVTDGFNTGYSGALSVSIVNALQAQNLNPADGETGVDPNAKISVSFNTPLDSATLNAASFKASAAGQTVKGALSYDSAAKKAVFAPEAKLASATEYRAELGDALTDTGGNRLTPLSWTFTTSDDNDAPAVETVYPAGGTVNIPTNSLVQIEFSESVNPDTVTASSVVVSDKTGIPVAGTVTLYDENKRAVFASEAGLAANTAYIVSVSTEVTDSTGLALAADFKSEFSTGSRSANSQTLMRQYRDQAVDENGDGLYDKLIVSVAVQVTQAGEYNLNGRLLTRNKNLIQWSSSGNVSLSPGVHWLDLKFDASPLRNSGIDGPYTLDSLNFYLSSNPALGEVALNAFNTYPYKFVDFFSVMTLGPLPDQLLKMDTVRDDAIDLRALTKHLTASLDTVSYKLLVNPHPEAGVSIDATNHIDIAPKPATESESAITVEAKDQLGNKVQSAFRVSVQAPAPGNLVATYEKTMMSNATQTVSVEIFDQFGDKFEAPATVSFETTLGTISPATVDAAAGRASAAFSPDNKAGTAFVTVRSGAAQNAFKIDILELKTYIVTPAVAAAGGGRGIVFPSMPQSIDAGQTLKFTLTADRGYARDSQVGGDCPRGAWSGDTWSTGPIVGNCTVIFNFVPSQPPINYYTVTPVAGTDGSVAPSAPQSTQEGATQSFAATAGRGYMHAASVGGDCPLGKWQGDVWTTGPIVKNCTVIFDFVPIEYPQPHKTLTVSLKLLNAGKGSVVSDPPGIDCGTRCTYKFTQQSQIALTATPAAGSTFGGWSGACTGKKPVCTVKLSSNRTVKAIFK